MAELGGTQQLLTAMNFGTLFKAFDTVMALREAARRSKGDPPPPAETALNTVAATGLAGQLKRGSPTSS